MKAPDFLFFAGLGGCCIGVVYSALIGAPDLVINVLGRGSVAVIIVAAAAILVGLLHVPPDVPDQRFLAWMKVQ